MATTYFPTTTPISVEDLNTWLSSGPHAEFPIGDNYNQLKAGTWIRGGKMYTNPTYDTGSPSLGAFRGAYYDNTAPATIDKTTIEYVEGANQYQYIFTWPAAVDDYSTSSMIQYNWRAKRSAKSGSDQAYYAWKSGSTGKGVTTVTIDDFINSSYSYIFEVQSIDDAGNISAWSGTLILELGLPDGTMEISMSTTGVNGSGNAGCYLAGQPKTVRYMYDGYSGAIFPGTTVIYTNPQRTTPFNGLYYQYWGIRILSGNPIQVSLTIDTNGLVTDMVDC